jgi:hypothetical protein
MTSLIQLITLDEMSHRSLDLACPTHYDEIMKTDIQNLSEKLNSLYYQILVVTQITEQISVELLKILHNTKSPMIVTSDTVDNRAKSLPLRQSGIRVVFSKHNTLQSISLNGTLKKLELMFYGLGTEFEIINDYDDILAILGKGTAVELYEHTGEYVSSTMQRTINNIKDLDYIHGIYVLFENHEGLPIIEIVEAMDRLEENFSDDVHIAFGIRNTIKVIDSVKITCMLGRYT